MTAPPPESDGAMVRQQGRLARSRLGEARQIVVRDRLPRRGIRDIRAGRRSDARIGVEGAHADADHIGLLLTLAPEGAAAVRAEQLREPLRRAPRFDQLLPGKDAQRAWRDSSGRSSRRAGAPLAARAVAVAGG